MKKEKEKEEEETRIKSRFPYFSYSQASIGAFCGVAFCFCSSRRETSIS